MPKKSKSTKNTEPVQVVEVVEEVPVLLPVVEEVVAPSHVIIEEPVQVEEPSVEVVKESSIESSNEDVSTDLLFNKLINQFADIQLAMKTLQSNLKILQKEVSKERKESKKKESKIKKKSTKKRSPSGFAKPSPITKELCDFIGVSYDTELARTEVTSKVIAYVKEFNLQNPENKKQIMVDEKLNKLLQPQSDDVITFFNLQTYLKKHFVNAPVVASTSSIQVI